MEDTPTTTIGVPDVDDVLSERVRTGLAEVESGLAEAVAVDDGLLDSTSRHLLDAGLELAHRERPVAAAEWCGYNDDWLVRLAR